jgi:phage baseplate assembly protein W
MRMTTLTDITSQDWSMQLDPLGQPGANLGTVVQGLDDVAQALAIIVTTPKGTDPLRPDFACDVLSFLDLPTPVLRPHAVREITLAITRYEPRVTVLGVAVNPQTAVNGSHVVITITWRLTMQGQASATQVTRLALPVTVH